MMPVFTAEETRAREIKWLVHITKKVHVEAEVAAQVCPPPKSGLSVLNRSGQRACHRLDLEPGFLHLDADLWDSLR